jgi:hypothetical protein
MTALRGFRLTTHSYESAVDGPPVEMRPYSYFCPIGHATTLRFSVEADEIPTTWDCPKCGRIAHADETSARRLSGTVEGLALSNPRSEAATKTHWDMLRERRTDAELEELLDERLTQLRGRGY